MEFFATPAPSIIVCLCLCLVKCAVVAGHKTRNGVTICGGASWWVLLLGAVAAGLISVFKTTELLLPVLLSFFNAYFHPYLRRASKHRYVYEGEMFRDINDRLVRTSIMYLAAAGVALFYRQYYLALMCGITYVGSTSYHTHREMGYFNMDNIFATALLMVYIYMMYSSYYHHDTVFTLAVSGFPVAGFLLAYCGMPADITLRRVGNTSVVCCTRTGREMYDSVHNLWHLVSGGGPMLAAWYFDFLVRNQLVTTVPIPNPLSGEVVEVSILTILPYAAFAFAIVANVIGNIFGVMPME